MKQKNHPWYQTVMANGMMDGQTDHGAARYASLGRWSALAYAMSGDRRFVPRSLKQLKGDSNNFTRLISGNGLREWGIEYNLIYDWLYPGMSDAERDEFARYLRRVADSVMAEGIRFHDSDQMVGTYFFLALVDQNLGTDYLTRRLYDIDRQEMKRVGGLDASATDLSTMRNSLKQFVAWGEGGAFIESSDYNRGTTELLYMGASALRNATGAEHFPDVEAFRQQHRLQIQHEFTPGLKDLFEWGDWEQRIIWASLDGLLAFLNVPAFEAKLRAVHGTFRTDALYPRVFYWSDPDQVVSDEPVATPVYVARGMGHAYARRGDRGLHVWMQTMYGSEGWVDHWYGAFGDFRLYRKGKFVIDHPLGYANPPSNHNILRVGRASSLERGGIIETQFEDGKFFRVSGFNAGPSPDQGSPEVIEEHVRTIHWLMDSDDDVVIVIDRIKANHPYTFRIHTPANPRMLEQSENRVVAAIVVGNAANQIVTVIDGSSVRVSRPGRPDALVSLIQPPMPAAAPSETVRPALRGRASASSTYGNFDAQRAADGEHRDLTWWNEAEAQFNVYPDWWQLDFEEPRMIGEVHVYSVTDSPGRPNTPTATQEFSKHGLVDFDVQVRRDRTGDWYTVGQVRDNLLVKRIVTFAPVITYAIRISMLKATDGQSRLSEVEAFEITGAARPGPQPVQAASLLSPISAPVASDRVNVAAAAMGARASASSTISPAFPPGGAIDGDVAGRLWGAGGGWNDATPEQFPDWLRIDFSSAKTIDRVDVFSVQDNYNSPGTPTPTMTFSLFGLRDFDVQYWTGTAWQTVTGGAVSGNEFIARQVTFEAVTTSAIRILVRHAHGTFSRIAEVQAFESAR
jgi:hypothetical protein